MHATQPRIAQTTRLLVAPVLAVTLLAGCSFQLGGPELTDEEFATNARLELAYYDDNNPLTAPINIDGITHIDSSDRRAKRDGISASRTIMHDFYAVDTSILTIEEAGQAVHAAYQERGYGRNGGALRIVDSGFAEAGEGSRVVHVTIDENPALRRDADLWVRTTIG